MVGTDENLNRAFNLCQKDFLHSDLIEMLKNGDDLEKQFAALNLVSVNSKDDAKILMSNLVGVDGKIRETVSIKVAEFVKISPEFFVEFSKIFIEATIDVNGNVCRNIVNSVSVLKNFPNFLNDYKILLIEKFTSTFNDYEKLTFKDKKYAISKVMFKFYWCLEVLSVIINSYREDELKEILLKCGEMSDYTVREKVAKILLNKFEDKDLNNLREKLKSDENYYVRQILK